MGSVLANSFAHTTSPVNTQQPRCKRVKFDPCFHVLLKLRWNLNAFLSWDKPGYSWKSVSKMLHWPSAPFVHSPLYSFPLTQLDLTACVRNSGILHSSLSSHSSVHKPGPLLCVHTFVHVHAKFISRRRITTSQIDSTANTFIKIPQATLFSHSSVRILHLMLDQHHAPVRPPYPPQPPVPTPYPHPYPLAIHTPTH